MLQLTVKLPTEQQDSGGSQTTQLSWDLMKKQLMLEVGLLLTTTVEKNMKMPNLN